MDMNLTRWTREILPWFSAQGIIRAERSPALVQYTTFTGPQGNLILGAADCAGARVFMTSRYVNPVSSRYRSVDMLFTLTHELAHVQQNALCTRAPGRHRRVVGPVDGSRGAGRDGAGREHMGWPRTAP